MRTNKIKNLNFHDFFQNCSENIVAQHCTKIDPEIKNTKEHDDNKYDNKSIQAFQNLYMQCFDLHLSSNPQYVTEETIKPDLARAKEFYNREQITNLFLSKYYNYPKINTYSYNEHTQKYSSKKTINKDEIKNEILSDIASQGKIIFLSGNVGEGKSSLLNKFYIESSITYEDDGWSYFPILIDVQKILKKYKNKVNTELFYSLILEKFIKEIEKKYKLPELEKNSIEKISSTKNSLVLEAKLALKALIANISTGSKLESIEINNEKTIEESVRKFDSPLSKINQLSETLDSNNIRMILMIDNLDTFSYSDERFMLFPNGFKKFKNNVNLAKDIINEILLNLENSPISYIFTLRPYVLSHIFDPSTENPLDIAIATRTTVYEINFDYKNDSKNIFMKRIELLDKLCSLIQDNHNIPVTKKENIKNIAQEYQNKILTISQVKDDKTSKDDKISKVFSDFYDITNQGYRSIVLFYKNLQYNPNIFERYFTHDVLHLYKLDFFQQYCQILPSSAQNNNCAKSKNYNFPNIFLVVCNAECNNAALDNEACYPNDFTYWLKYLVLLLLYKNNQKTTLSNLINIFTSNRKGYYEEHALKLTLGSLGTINEYNCIKYNFDSENLQTLKNLLDNTKVSLTNRGAKIVDNNNTFAFYNLQYFTDDWLLPKPKHDKIGIEDLNLNHSYNYDYLLKEEKYSDNLNKITLQKAKETILFLYYLEYSFKYEKEKYHQVWQHIESLCPNELIFKEDFFIQARKNIVAFIKSQHKHNNKEIINKVHSFLKESKKYEHNIDKFFRKIYAGNLQVKCNTSNKS